MAEPDIKDILLEEYWRPHKNIAQPVTWSPEAMRELAVDAARAADYIQHLEEALSPLVERSFEYVKTKRLPYNPAMECDAQMYALASAGRAALAAANHDPAGTEAAQANYPGFPDSSNPADGAGEEES